MKLQLDEPRPFKLVSPASVEDAVKLRNDRRGEAMYLAGGGDVADMVKRHLARPALLIDLKGISSLQGIRANFTAPEPGFTLGALTTLREVAEDEGVRRYLPALAMAASRVATPQIRNVGTVGGNLLQENRCPYYRGEWNCYRKGGMHCYADHGFNREHAIFQGDRCYVVSPSDLAPVIVAGNAIIHVHGLRGPRTIPAEELFVRPSQNLMRMHSLDKGEVLTAVEFRVREPQPHEEFRVPGRGLRGSVSPLPLEQRFPSIFIKYAMRNAFDFALASVAVILDRQGDGRRASRCAIVLGAVAATPYRARDAERVVVGNVLTDEVIHQAARAAAQGAKPLELNE
ncbi:MAG TPA: FAD binding domain-containing protein, partial [Polyangia bacterium]|nr:FAD binding domain-containing protein [Polyangia bacterium]